MDKKKSKRLITAYGILLLSAAILLLFYSYIIRALNERVQQQEWEHSIVSGNYMRLQAQLMDKYVEQDENKLQDLLTQLPVQADTSRIVRVLAALEVETGLRMENISFGAEMNQENEQLQADSLLEMLRSGYTRNNDRSPQDQFPLPSVNFRVQYAGTVQQLQDFLQRIHDLERIIVIEGFDYSHSDSVVSLIGEADNSDGQVVRGSVSLRALYADQFRSFITGF
jgi:Tfp pilus assembly protein PilO